MSSQPRRQRHLPPLHRQRESDHAGPTGEVETDIGSLAASFTVGDGIFDLGSIADAPRGCPGLDHPDYRGQSVAW